MEYLLWKFYGRGAYELGGEDKYFKKDDDMTTSTTGTYNATYGAQTWAQMNQEANIFGVLPKFPWDRDGWRVISGAAGTSADGGYTENGGLPATIKPVWAEVSAKAKTISHTFSVSELQQITAQNQNDAVGSMDYMRSVMANKHREAMNQQLGADADTTITTTMESIDRVACNSTEESNDLTAGDGDIYNLDRSNANNWYHAIVDENSKVDRDLTDTLLRGLLDNVREAGGNSSIWITGHDTYAAIQGLYEAQVRYQIMEQKQVKIGVNGIDTAEGLGVGLNVSSLYGLPVIVSSDITKDTISRVYLLDTSDPEGFGKPRLGIKVMKPTQYFENGVSSGDPFVTDAFADEGAYRTMGELICHNFHAQGKIRELK